MCRRPRPARVLRRTLRLGLATQARWQGGAAALVLGAWEACGRDNRRQTQREGPASPPFVCRVSGLPRRSARPMSARHCGAAAPHARQRHRWVVLRTHSEPIFNVPAVVTALIAVLVAVHGVREWLLSPEHENRAALAVRIRAARYESSMIGLGSFPGGLAADAWTFVTYALLHGSWTHLILNSSGCWLSARRSRAASGRALPRFLRRHGGRRRARASATHVGMRVPMIGASAAISGFMAAAIRFAFQRGGPLRLIGQQ